MHTFLRRFTLLAAMACALPVHAKPVTVTFIHFNDLHAHLTAHWDVVRDGDKSKVAERGGLARSATLIKRLRKDNPNSVLMNIGDTYHGGVEALYTNGNAIVDPVNALGIDVGVPGNWDYAYGPMVTRLRYADLSRFEMRILSRVNNMMTPTGDIKRPNFPNLAANVSFVMPPWKIGKTFLPATLVKEVGGVKIGFIGITSDIVPRMHEMLAMGLSFMQGEDKYRALINRHAKTLREEGAQLVVVMSELGIQKDYRLAQVVDTGAVDVFFSAHTHEATFAPLTSSSGALVVEAGNDGYIGRMDITVDSGKVKARNWKLLPVDRALPEDPEMKRLVAQARAPFLVANPNIKLPMAFQDQVLTQSIDTVVGHVKGALDRRNALESTFNASFAEALRKRGNSQIAITPGFRFDSVIAEPGEKLEDNTVAKGAITVEDVYRFFPVSYTISTAKITADNLKEMMEQALDSVFAPDAFAQSGGWFEGFAGLKIGLDLGKPKGERVRSLALKSDGHTLSGNEILSAVGCSRPMDKPDVLCSYDGFTVVESLNNPTTRNPWTIADLFTDMLKQGEILPVELSITDLNHTPQWPSSAYVQPLSGVKSEK